MKHWKDCPLLVILVLSGLLLTALAIYGRGNIYKTQPYDPGKAPLLSLVFTAGREGIYPWSTEPEPEEPEPPKRTEPTAFKEEPTAFKEEPVALMESPVPSKAPLPSLMPSPTKDPVPVYGENRMTPLTETTKEEYNHHISADIYGDAGVKKAAKYPFVTVDESYFDDALFIGDSRTVGLYDYTDLKEHADFLCKTSLTIYKVLEEDFKGAGTVEQILSERDYGKIYLMLGINELGRGTTEDFMQQYTTVVDTLHELEPEAKIIVQAILRVSGSKNQSDAIFNNSNINARNNAIATLADNYYVFYIDLNEVTSDENGDLNAEFTHDQVHLLGAKCEVWKEFLLSHGIETSKVEKLTS